MWGAPAAASRRRLRHRKPHQEVRPWPPSREADRLKPSPFGLPEERKYQMPDESHAANAKARAAQQVKAGNLTKADEKKIDRKADKILDA